MKLPEEFGENAALNGSEEYELHAKLKRKVMIKAYGQHQENHGCGVSPDLPS